MTKDMPCQHVLYQSYLCYSSIIKIRLVFVSIYNSQYHKNASAFLIHMILSRPSVVQRIPRETVLMTALLFLPLEVKFVVFIPFPVSVSDVETAILQRLLSFHQIPDVMHIMTK